MCQTRKGVAVSDVAEVTEEARVSALAELLGEDVEDWSAESWDECLFSSVGGREYLVLSDAEADERTREYIEQTVWAFRAEWLAHYMPAGVDVDVVELLQEKCEGANGANDANDALVAMLADRFDEFVEDSIGADGRGHFLSSYDGCEEEAGAFYVYRVH